MPKYHIAIRCLHWLMAICIIAMLVLGFFMSGNLAYNIHKTLGISLIFLIFIRIIVRLLTKAPAFPVGFKKRDIVLAKLGHFALYALMIIMPLSGWFMIDFGANPIKVFGTELFSLVDKNKDLRKIAYQIHETLPYILIFMISAHVLAVVKHKIVDKVNLLKRIL